MQKTNKLIHSVIEVCSEKHIGDSRYCYVGDSTDGVMLTFDMIDLQRWTTVSEPVWQLKTSSKQLKFFVGF